VAGGHREGHHRLQYSDMKMSGSGGEDHRRASNGRPPGPGCHGLEKMLEGIEKPREESSSPHAPRLLQLPHDPELNAG